MHPPTQRLELVDASDDPKPGVVDASTDPKIESVDASGNTRNELLLPTVHWLKRGIWQKLCILFMLKCPFLLIKWFQTFNLNITMFIGGNSVGENHFYLSNLGLEHSEMKICVLPRNIEIKKCLWLKSLLKCHFRPMQRVSAISEHVAHLFRNKPY